MLVCHCRAVYASDVRAAIESGARDEFDVAAMCGAGTGCGGCVPTVTAMLAEAGGCAAGCALSATLHRPELAGSPAPARSPLAQAAAEVVCPESVRVLPRSGLSNPA